MKPLTVAFVPRDVRNPYQTLLADGLRHFAVQVITTRGGWFFSLRTPGVWRAHIIHIHWIDQLAVGPGRFTSVFRSGAVMAQLLALRLAGKRLVWTVHNLKSHESQQAAIERLVSRFVARRASMIIVHCDRAVPHVVSTFGLIDKQRPIVIPHGHYIGRYPNTISRAESRVRLGITTSGPVFLLLGSLRDYKGVPDLIAAFKSLQGSDAALIIAGAPRTLEGGAGLREQIGDDRRIYLREHFVPDAEVQVYMNAADAVVLPYREVLTSGAAVLAMSFGRPCVAPSLGCLPDLLDDSCGFLYDPSISGGLAGALRRAIADRDRLADLGRAARHRVEAWSWLRVAEATRAAYERCLGLAATGD